MSENERGRSYDTPSSYYSNTVEVGGNDAARNVELNIPNSSLASSNVSQESKTTGLEYNHAKNSTIEHKETKINNLSITLVVAAVSGTTVVGVATMMNELMLDVSLFSKNSSSLVFEINKNNYNDVDRLYSLLTYDDDPNMMFERDIYPEDHFIRFEQLDESSNYTYKIYYYHNYYSRSIVTFGTDATSYTAELGVPLDQSFTPYVDDELVSGGVTVLDYDTGLIEFGNLIWIDPNNANESITQVTVRYLENKERTPQLKFSGSYMTTSIDEDVGLEVMEYEENYLAFAVYNDNQSRFPYLNVEVFDSDNKSILKKDAMDVESSFEIDYRDEAYYKKNPFTAKPLYITVRYGDMGLAYVELEAINSSSYTAPNITHESASDVIGPHTADLHFVIDEPNRFSELTILMNGSEQYPTCEPDGSFVVHLEDLDMDTEYSLWMTDALSNVIESTNVTFKTLDLDVIHLSEYDSESSGGISVVFQISDPDRADEIQVTINNAIFDEFRPDSNGEFDVYVEDGEPMTEYTVVVTYKETGFVYYEHTYKTTVGFYLDKYEATITYKSITVPGILDNASDIDYITVYFDNEEVTGLTPNADGIFWIEKDSLEPESEHYIQVVDNDGRTVDEYTFTTDYVVKITQGTPEEPTFVNAFTLDFSTSFFADIEADVRANYGGSDISEAIYSQEFNKYSYRFYDEAMDCNFSDMIRGTRDVISDLEGYDQTYYLDVMYDDNTLYTFEYDADGPIKPLVYLYQYGNRMVYYNGYDNGFQFNADDREDAAGLEVWLNDEFLYKVTLDDVSNEFYVSFNDLEPETGYTLQIKSANGGICYEDSFTTEAIVDVDVYAQESNTMFDYTWNYDYILDLQNADPDAEYVATMKDSLDNVYGEYSVTTSGDNYYGSFNVNYPVYNDVTYYISLATMEDRVIKDVLYTKEIHPDSTSFPNNSPKFEVSYDDVNETMTITYLSGTLPEVYAGTMDVYTIQIISEDRSSYNIIVGYGENTGAIDFVNSTSYTIDLNTGVLLGETAPADTPTFQKGTKYYVYVLLDSYYDISMNSFTA